jgi:hypothetical protein
MKDAASLTDGVDAPPRGAWMIWTRLLRCCSQGMDGAGARGSPPAAPSPASGTPEKSMHTTSSTATLGDPAAAPPPRPAHTLAHRPSQQSRTETAVWPPASPRTPPNATCRSGTMERWMTGGGATRAEPCAGPAVHTTVRTSCSPAKVAKIAPPKRTHRETSAKACDLFFFMAELKFTGGDRVLHCMQSPRHFSLSHSAMPS